MATILCYGDSNTWGYVPASFDSVTGLSQRFDHHTRWPCILNKEMGDEYHVVEEGINGRTTNLDETLPNLPYKNGLELLAPTLEAHYPLALVIFMLGTNDVKMQFNRNVNEIVEGLRVLIKVIKSSNKGINGDAPKVLIIAPQPTFKVANFHPMRDDHSVEKSKQLKDAYVRLAKEENCDFFDASQVVKSSSLDGVHLDIEGHKILGISIAKLLRQII